jgi:hypothetical protein
MTFWMTDRRREIDTVMCAMSQTRKDFINIDFLAVIAHHVFGVLTTTTRLDRPASQAWQTPSDPQKNAPPIVARLNLSADLWLSAVE